MTCLRNHNDVWSIFWNLFLHSRIGHTSFLGTLKKHSRLLRLRHVSGNTRVLFLLEFGLHYWCGAACCYKRKYNPGVKRSSPLCRHSGSDRFLPLLSWQRRIPWEHCRRVRLVRKKIAGPYAPAAGSGTPVICTDRLGHCGRPGPLEAFGNSRHLETYGL